MAVEQSHPRRLVGDTGFVILMLAAYVGTAPIVRHVDRRFPFAAPLVDVVYAPLTAALQRPESPSSRLLSRYFDWCNSLLQR